ncbi:divalent cation transporter, carboxyterminus [Ectocarpus siliculosus]|uniref:Divalent cation transporter, carboxyterminus n=1 Tax=Ectocarpus siliculosus TaxID=2880 RepID=D7FSM0_ECTSI|nr:divalent cation transporter, carboxyterminus [Ectocarpus siliculosus]|eukprot:CBJ31161.1 divalent cation transporter, carboxyterminus [Ectocarpus siliculosus]
MRPLAPPLRAAFCRPSASAYPLHPRSTSTSLCSHPPCDHWHPPTRTTIRRPPASAGEASVIPFGVGEGRYGGGVVQIPLHFSVGETVDFIRTIATVDRDYRRELSSPLVHLPEGGGGEAAAADGMGSSLSSRIYVTENGTLKGYITMAVLLTHQSETPVAELLRELEEMLHEGDSWEDAAHRLRQANVLAAPVVDSDGVLVAVLNPSDLLQEMEIEATDDIMRQSGSGGGESYFGTPLPSLVASRVGWLVSLLCLQSFSSLILQSFQNVIEKNIVIALFLTMLTGTAGNAGNQSSAIVIRGLATEEIHQGNRWRVIWREARAGVASACVLSVASFVRVLLTPGATTVATLAVSVAMGTTVVGAVMFGTIAPIVLHGMGVDPVNFASPALATLTDVSGVFILCSVAKLMLGDL